MSERRAYAVLHADRSSIRYQPKRVNYKKQHKAIKRISKERRRFGYRRIYVMMQREVLHMNHKKLRRIYTEKKVAGTLQRWAELRSRYATPHGNPRRAKPALKLGLRV